MSVTVTLRFTLEEYSKLERLAERRGSSIAACLRKFADACQPEGGSWRHPMSATLPETEDDDTLVS